jgi:RHS repeat-associated protein
VFGVPYEGDLNGGMNLGYTGKPYDVVTGMYNYGYRDYSPEAARFTTEDPVRDGANWFAYVNNDPVNWVDPWGLSASDKTTNKDPEFEEFMDFLHQQGVYRVNPEDEFIFEKIDSNWDNMPKSVREYEPGTFWGNIVDDMGNHPQNQRLPDGYHISLEKDGYVYVHRDTIDPTNGLIETILHNIKEVLTHPSAEPSYPRDDKYPDWSER